MILDIFEMICGTRMTTSYVQIGGVWKDVPPAFASKVEIAQPVPDTPGRLRAHATKALFCASVWKASAS